MRYLKGCPRRSRRGVTLVTCAHPLVDAALRVLAARGTFVSYMSTTQNWPPTWLLPNGLKITIESANYQLRKIIKNRGHFPDDDAAIKLLYLGIRNITGRHIDGEGLTLQRGERGTGTLGWKRALNALAVRFGDRLPI
jgi:transposase-like protein